MVMNTYRALPITGSNDEAVRDRMLAIDAR